MAQPNLTGGRIAALLLLIAAVGTVGFMTLHPTVGSPGYESLAQEVVAESPLNRLVHGAMIVFLLGYFIAMSFAADRFGGARIDVRAAQVFLAAATATMIGATLASGFVTPELARWFVDEGAAGDADFRSLLRISFAANQAFATTASALYGAAILLWSLRLISTTGFARIAGIAGIVIGPAILFAILTGHIRLNVFGMGVLAAAMGVWFALVAVATLRRD